LGSVCMHGNHLRIGHQRSEPLFSLDFSVTHLLWERIQGMIGHVCAIEWLDLR
jgi:hypothetical protein